MEDPELTCYDVKDIEKQVQPLPPLAKRENIPASIIEVNPPGRIPPPQSLTVITNNSERGSRNSTSRKQVVLAIAVGILAILSTVFVTLYFATEGKVKPCDCQNSLANKENASCIDVKKIPCVCKNCSLVSNCSKFNISTITENNTVPKSCSDIYKKGVKIDDGVYRIYPDGLGAFNVRCDMTTSGGGWTVFQRRVDGSINFYRGWNAYKKGFGNLNGEFWLGLDKIHRLSDSGQNYLRVDLEDFQNNARYAQYSTFTVASEGEKYKLTVGGYSGNAGDSLSYHNGIKFSTKDEDNDHLWYLNCAVSFKGAWWYKACHHSSLNAQYLRGHHNSSFEGVIWVYWKGHKYSLKKTEMKIRPRSF